MEYTDRDSIRTHIRVSGGLNRLSSIGLRPRCQIRINKTVALDLLSGFHVDFLRKHGACPCKGMELAILSTGIDSRRQFPQERRIPLPSGEARWNFPRIHACQPRPQTGRHHLFRQCCRWCSPEWEYRFQTGPCELRHSIGSDLFQEQVAKCYSSKTLPYCARTCRSHARLVLSVRAGKGKIDLP